MAIISAEKILPDYGSAAFEYNYPKTPDRLKIFTKHGLLSRPKTPAVRYLEHMLTKTTLTTQKVSHDDVEEIGQKLHDHQVQIYREQEAASVANAVRKTTEIMKQEQKRLLQQAAHQAVADKEAALMNQKIYYEELAQRTRMGRDKLEEEKIERVILKKDNEKKQALKEQWERAEKLKLEAIERVLIEQHKKLRACAALEREKAIASALRVARERFAHKLEKKIELTREECRLISEEIEEKNRKLHEIEIQRLNERIASLNAESKNMMEKQLLAQKDYVDMEKDYSRFLDFAPHPCRSEYLLLSRRFRHGVERKRCSRASQTDLMAFEQKSVAVETNLRILARR